MKKETIRNLEEGFIHDARVILFDKNMTSEEKIIKLVVVLDMYQTIKDMQQIWPDSRKIVERCFDNYNGENENEKE